MGKPTRTARQLQQMLIEEIEALPGMQGQQTDVHRAGVRWRDPGEGGANWMVPIVTDRSMHRLDIARVIRQMQERYDLDTD